MSEIRFSLPGSEMVTLTGRAIDKLIRAGDGDAALLYLYILKTKGQGTSDEAAAALGKGAGWIATAMAALSRLGLVEIDARGDGAADGAPLEEEIDAPRRYTLDEVKLELTAGSAFSTVLEETQRTLGRILNPDELLRLFGIYDSLRLPPEVIMLLITHCIFESRRTGGGRAPSLRYIEKAAYTWEREGIVTLESAERYIKALEAQRSERGRIKTALQIRDREFSATERRYVDGWIGMGFGDEAIAIAYDKTIIKTGKLSWGYMDTILKNWHGRGIHSLKEIMARDRKPDKTASQPAQHASARGGAVRGSGGPDREELERMKRLLEKITED